jgi:6-pyruvoyltetrahydropterin/6-carboxytetrahydropterin synthase
MSICVIAKDYTFDAAHFIKDHPRCGQLHGHTWHMEVSVMASINPKTGMVLDFHSLNSVVRPIIATLDHTTLNSNPLIKDLPIVTAETIAEYLCDVIADQLFPYIEDDAYTVTVTLQEGEGGRATCCEERIKELQTSFDDLGLNETKVGGTA